MTKQLLSLSLLLMSGMALCAGGGDEAVLSGLDRLEQENFAALAGKRVGLVTNHTAVTRDGRHIADVLASAQNLQLVALFGPEHGVRGTLEAGAHLEDQKDPKTGVPVYSLYGGSNKPTPEMLQGVDVLVFDIQDVGARFFTYISTLFYCEEASAEMGIPFIILDRPNPVGGVIVEGPVLDMANQSFVGIQAIPIRHGMTVGELAQLFNGEGWLEKGVHANVQVIKAANWKRDQFFNATGLPWIKPSPNMTSPQTALLYPGNCLVEATNLSEGRGTSSPFQQIGAPWLDAASLCETLRSAGLEGVTIDTVTFTPINLPGIATNNKHQDRRCRGVAFAVTDPRNFRAVELGVRLLAAVRSQHPDSLVIRAAGMDRLSGDSRLAQALIQGKGVEELLAIVHEKEARFLAMRRPYLLY
jgi:uncharacterized protein YbbC (DUF1343 family)